MICIEQQNAVLRHNADHHNQAHKGGDIERLSRDQKRQKYARGGEQRRRKDCRGRRESAEFKKQHGEDEDYSQREDQQKIPERLLLLFIRSAVDYSDGRRNLQLRHRLLHRFHAFAEADALEPSGHRNVSLQVLATNFGLPGFILKLGQ